MNRSKSTQYLVSLVGISLVSCSLAWGNDATRSNPRFLVRNDSVYDRSTNLTWKICSVGQHWKVGTGCEGPVRTFTFDEAQTQKGGGWRLATGEELAGLFDHPSSVNKQQHLDQEEFPDTNIYKQAYWTRIPSSVGPDWGVDFNGGKIAQSKRIIPHAVRLVKGKQK